jgi:predicted RNA-binding Zn-ribbon protein involved in translation (DUF1610 family)
MGTPGIGNNEGLASAEDLLVQAKIASARHQVEELRLALPLLSAQTLLSEMAGRSSVSMEHNEAQVCVACGFTGTSTGVITSRRGNNHYDGSVTYTNRLGVARFECSVCGLELVGETEVMAAGLPTVIEFQIHEYPDGVRV